MIHPQTTPTHSSDTQSRRYVVLRHDGCGGTEGEPDTHWDLMLEIADQEKLATWRIAAPPESWTAASPPGATRIADHRPIYLDYQGPISGDRGHVTRVASGAWSLLNATPTTWQIQLRGDVSIALTLPANPANPANPA